MPSLPLAFSFGRFLISRKYTVHGSELTFNSYLGYYLLLSSYSRFLPCVVFWCLTGLGISPSRKRTELVCTRLLTALLEKCR